MRFRRSAGALSRALRILLVAGGLLSLVGIGAALGVYLVLLRDLPDLRTLDDYKPALATRVVDRHGKLYAHATTTCIVLPAAVKT